jgi:hypothetical protein
VENPPVPPLAAGQSRQILPARRHTASHIFKILPSRADLSLRVAVVFAKPDRLRRGCALHIGYSRPAMNAYELTQPTIMFPRRERRSVEPAHRHGLRSSKFGEPRCEQDT